jgi:hypothetical protein
LAGILLSVGLLRTDLSFGNTFPIVSEGTGSFCPPH